VGGTAGSKTPGKDQELLELWLLRAERLGGPLAPALSAATPGEPHLPVLHFHRTEPKNTQPVGDTESRQLLLWVV
jgi:hypothetical protein